MNGRKVLLLLLVVFIIIIFLSIFSGYESIWKIWNIPSCPPSFLDAYVLTYAAESYALGFDPIYNNPQHPLGVNSNYPRIWHFLFALGINRNHAIIIGSIFVILFFIGLFIFLLSKKFDNLTNYILAIVIFSPSVILGIERANNDLLIFFLVSLALVISYYSDIKALFFFLFAAILKLYPAFGLIYLLKENKRRFWILLLLALSVLTFYVIFSLDDLIQVYKSTPQLVGSSFGINVWWKGLRHSRFLALPVSDSLMHLLKVSSYILAFLIISTTLFFSSRQNKYELFRGGEYIDAFRVGAAIYIGCFLIINSHDYRLIFLIFTIPQIVAWLRNSIKDISAFRGKEKGILLVPLITLLAMIFSLWSFFIMRFLGRKITFLMEEFSNWIILTGLLFLFFSSLPDWFSNYLYRPFSLMRRFNK
jgi:hypothetical protein